MGLSNNITAVVNFVALLASIPIIAAGIWLASKPDNECIHDFRWPVVVLGIMVLVVSLAGFLGAYFNRQSLLAFYLFCMALLILLLLFVLAFSFVVTSPDGSFRVPGRSFEEYNLEGFSAWLRNHVTSSERWHKISTCLAGSNVCTKLAEDYVTAYEFFNSNHISPLQSGCCKPPAACEYTYVNPVLWVNPANPMDNPDCYMWNNDQIQLCYNCNACKAGLLGNLRREWRRANMILLVALAVLVWVYIFACCAYKNARRESLFRHYKHGWF
ncbi:hypothetical protein QN277_000845 [Acacia crassicarpa]|uniref:Tetraspanin-2 n=1 Tax=Acacia crassicarpa TaxID=499986 RepID=A0AAE1N618_9FABA|nr:hypothetical protein QN277_000845 [Acacia crassicarpa]